jgi:hypothetical protein
MVEAVVYLHASAEHMIETGEKLGLTGEVLRMFRHACTEVEVTLDVDTNTGLVTIIAVDGRPVTKMTTPIPVTFTDTTHTTLVGCYVGEVCFAYLEVQEVRGQRAWVFSPEYGKVWYSQDQMETIVNKLKELNSRRAIP